MRKALALVVCLAMVCAIVFVGCEGTSNVPDSNKGGENIIVDNRNDYTEDIQEEQNTQQESIGVTDEDFSIVGYLYEDTFSSMYFLVVTNNSKVPVSLSANGIARDANDGMIGADDLSIDVLGPGETSVGYFYFSDVKDVASVDYTFEYDTSTYYYPVISNLSVEQTLNDRNVTVKVTNNGNSCAEFVEAHALFFDSNKNLIYHASNYVVDNDNEIKPGKSITTQLDSYESYDHVEVYFTGRSTGKTVDPNAVSVVSDSDFEINEHLYAGSFSTQYYLIVKSNASVAVGITANATAKDANGAVLGAASMEIDILGPGETSIGYFYFADVLDVATVEYELSYDTEPYYTPVLGNLSVEQTINAENIVVGITNNGTKPARFVEVYALFFDADNNVVETASSYVVDDDSEIKPGKTLVEQLNAYDSFDHVEVYLTGRGD